MVIALLLIAVHLGNLQEIRIPRSRWEQAAKEIKRVKPSTFPRLPSNIAAYLESRSCMVPQVWGATEPGNVISGEFYRTGQQDWAVLCSCKGRVTILVFPQGRTDRVDELAQSDEISYLQVVVPQEIGFSRAIATVGKAYIVSHHKGGPKPTPIDHEGINDIFVEKASIVHYWHKEKWIELSGAD